MAKLLIEKLTPEQESQLAEYCDKWIKIGLSTEPADREKAERAIATMYRTAGLEPPRKYIWCGSPLSQGLTRTIILDKKLARRWRTRLPRARWRLRRWRSWERK